MVSRKRKKEDKAKTQLKKPRTAPGKHLPKGTNVTKTEFRVAKIVIPGQLSTVSHEGPTTSKKLGLKEVLSKLGHFSQAVRSDALEGLKELLTSKNPAALVTANLSFILTSLIPVTQDKERKLRQLAISLLPLILSHVNPVQLSPLHSLLSAHLCCSLTHIDPRIQQDGLTMLDTMLDKAPNFVKANYSLLLPNCLDQISNKKVGEKGPSVAANMSESMTALQWRVLVLTRVERLLDTVLQLEEVSKCSMENERSFNFTPGMHCALWLNTSTRWLPISSLTTRVTTSSLVTNIKLVMPLLIETWVEARANDGNTTKGAVLSREVGDLLLCEAGLMDKLVRVAVDTAEGCNKRSVLKLIKEKFLVDIKHHFLEHLPYSSQGRSCDQANAILCCLSFAINESFDENMVTVAVKVAASKHVAVSTRLRLAKQLLVKSELTVDQRNGVVLALVELVGTFAGKDKVATMDLLKEQAVKWPEEESIRWVEDLPDQLMNLGEIDQMETVLDICLALAKTCNQAFSSKFLSSWSSIQERWMDTENVNQKLNFIKHHCDSSRTVPLATVT